MTPDLLRRAVNALGGGYGDPVATRLGVTPETLRRWWAGSLDMPEGLAQRVRELLRERHREITTIIDEMEAEPWG